MPGPAAREWRRDWRGEDGNIPGGEPLPSQFNRFTRPRKVSSEVALSEVCRCFRAWKVSTATGVDRPLASPNGPDSPISYGPPSKSSEQPISSRSCACSTCAFGMT